MFDKPGGYRPGTGGWPYAGEAGATGSFGGNGHQGSFGLSGQSSGYGLVQGSAWGRVFDGFARGGSGSLIPDYSQGLLSGYRQQIVANQAQSFPVSFSNIGSAPQAEPAVRESPSSRGTTLITTYDDYGIMLGSHSALYIPGKGLLYDPGGQYESGKRPSGDAFYDDEADLDAFIKHHEASGSKVYLTTLPTTASEEEQIAANVEKVGGKSKGACATAVSGALDGVCGVEGSFYPGWLHDQADRAARDR